MFEELEKQAAVLADAKTAWVNRRDAADWLGAAALRAIKALHAHLADADADVRMAVEKAVGQLGLPAQGRVTYTFAQLAAGCAKPNERVVTRQGEGYLVEVMLHRGRRQRIELEQFRREDGVEMIRLLTHCGKPTPDALPWAMRANRKLTQGALALDGEEENAELVLIDTMLMDSATPDAVRIAVKALAGYGDWIETKLTGQDNL